MQYTVETLMIRNNMVRTVLQIIKKTTLKISSKTTNNHVPTFCFSTYKRLGNVTVRKHSLVLKSSVTSLHHQELFEYLDMTTFSAHLTCPMEPVKWKSNVEDDGAHSLCFFPFMWLVKPLSPIFDISNILQQQLHFADDSFPSTFLSQSLNRESDSQRSEKVVKYFFLDISISKTKRTKLFEISSKFRF